MFLKTTTKKYIPNYSEKIEKIKNLIDSADAILIGAGAGLSTSAGFSYSGERFLKYFTDFHKKYGIQDMYQGGFYPYKTLEEFWGFWSRNIYYNRYKQPKLSVYENLLSLVKDKNYFVLTTNVDHCFQNTGFNKDRLFYTQGDYGLLQCKEACHNKTYDNEEVIYKMLQEQKDMKIPTELIPYCPVCGKAMTTNLRINDRFVQDEGWENASKNFKNFIDKYAYKNLVLLELGVGGNTPAIIKYRFWQLAFQNKLASYICINYNEAFAPTEIEKQSICINEDIAKVLQQL